MTRDYIIAGEVIRLEGRGADLAALRGFDPFRLPEDHGRNILCRIETETPLSDWHDNPAVETIDTFPVEHIECSFSRHAEGYAFRMQAPGKEPVLMWHTRGSDVILSNVGLLGEPDPTSVRFMLWITVGLALLPVSGVAVHTSVIVWKGQCVLFLGESGTGKSTHTSLWLKHIPDTFLLNDDSPIVRLVDGTPIAFGSPWSGKTPMYRNEKYPIAAIVRLSQAPHNKIQRLNRLKAFGALLPSCPPSFAHDEVLMDGLCRIISGIIEKIPVFHLECLPDEAAARLVFDTVFGDGETNP